MSYSGNDPTPRGRFERPAHRYNGPDEPETPGREDQAARMYDTGRVQVPAAPRGRDFPPIDTTDPRKPIRTDEIGRANRYPNRRELLEAAVQGLAPGTEEDPLLDLKRFVLRMGVATMIFGMIYLLLSIFVLSAEIVGHLS